MEYAAPTPHWAVYNAPEQGFNPEETRFRKVRNHKDKKTKTNDEKYQEKLAEQEKVKEKEQEKEKGSEVEGSAESLEPPAAVSPCGGGQQAGACACAAESTGPSACGEQAQSQDTTGSGCCQQKGSEGQGSESGCACQN